MADGSAAMELVLASGSPRRRELLSQAGFAFKVIVPSVTESAHSYLTGRELTVCNAARKALAVANVQRDSIVVGADTLVVLEGEVIGKPRDLAHAAAILHRLSGRTHQVISAVFICAGRARMRICFHVISDVQFRKLSSRAIDSYLALIDPLDKVGAYAAQSEGAHIIAEIRGSYSNVIGLPMAETTRALRRFGIRPRRDQRVSTTSRSTGPTA